MSKLNFLSTCWSSAKLIIRHLLKAVFSVKNGFSSSIAHPIMANAGSSCRSKGKSIRKLVLNRAVMVTAEQRRDHRKVKKTVY